jgi:FkbM family methyltransferase
MNLQNQVKLVLRHCGHAMVSTVHDRLNAIDRVLQDLLDQNTDSQKAQTALLQAGVHQVENLARIRAAIDNIASQLQMSLPVLEPAARETSSFLANQALRQVSVETSDYFSTNPQMGLLSFLYSHLPSRRAFDIGAHVGDVSEHLLETGYEVYAFEPYPQSYSRLRESLGARPGFHAFPFALGSASAELPLHLAIDRSPDSRYEDPTVFHSLAPHGMPAGLSFNGTVPVPVRTLSDLHNEGLVPPDAALVKIDTEGYDLEVIRGMGDYRYPVVMVEFWDANIPFADQGLRYTLDSMVGEMRQRGYLWYVVVYRVWGRNQTAFFCNHDRPVPESWGNILFFQEREIFSQAQQWCSAVLPRTYFKHVPANPRSKG